ncbi:ComF family protein [Agrobacterium larrymoorei]|uniref:ComF family protein n=1 Tax=Agrobacterium larrymoorei TaxID=160699 RepID=UPI0015717A3F|nr:ComF family protein [Agrobacterium larrymoorei]NTJ44817.1 ComF family protein [Agrobacterium larrymoorei]
MFSRQSVAQPIGWFLRHARDFVYPPSCAGCGRATGGAGGFCIQCWSGIKFIERPYCEILGIPFAYHHGDGSISAEAIANPPPFDRLRSATLHDGPARKLVHQLKYLDRTDLARQMASWMLRASDDTVANCDFIMPVPLHRRRFLSRRFNQSAELARHLSAMSGKAFLPSTLVRVKPTSRQVGLSARARKDNVRGAFAISPGRETDVMGKRIVLVDDVYTTGATVAAAAKRLKKSGAADVTVLTFAMAISGPI